MSSNDGQAATLVVTERWWRDHYYHIEARGYRLRPRYHPQWVSSWYNTGQDFARDGRATTVRIVAFDLVHFLIRELKSRAVMDATRIRDGRPVLLKKVLPVDRPHELSIHQLFSSEELSNHPNNHCVPLLDVIELPANFGTQKLMVFPLLRPFNQPRIQTFGEFVAFFTQICEARQNLFTCSFIVLILFAQGIRFMHERSVAHRYESHAHLR